MKSTVLLFALPLAVLLGGCSSQGGEQGVSSLAGNDERSDGFSIFGDNGDFRYDKGGFDTVHNKSVGFNEKNYSDFANDEKKKDAGFADIWGRK